MGAAGFQRHEMVNIREERIESRLARVAQPRWDSFAAQVAHPTGPRCDLLPQPGGREIAQAVFLGGRREGIAPYLTAQDDECRSFRRFQVRLVTPIVRTFRI
jgi:hypothetical protein